MASIRPNDAVASRSHRILLVDDSEDGSATLAALLELRGHLVEVAHDGPAALQRAPAFMPDAVVLDIGLPGMSGLEVARRLRELPQLNRIVLIALTGHGSPADRVRTRDAGFDHHFTKPLDFPALDRLLSGMPEPRSAGESAATEDSRTD